MKHCWFLINLVVFAKMSFCSDIDTVLINEIPFDSLKLLKTIEMAKEFKIELVSDFKKLRFFYNKTKGTVRALEIANRKNYQFGSLSKHNGYYIVEYGETSSIVQNEKEYNENDSIVTLIDDACIKIFVDVEQKIIFKIHFGG